METKQAYTRDMVIDELLNNKDYRVNVEEILKLHFENEPEVEQEWKNWFDGKSPEFIEA